MRTRSIGAITRPGGSVASGTMPEMVWQDTFAIGHRDLVALIAATNAGQIAKPTPPRVAGDTRIAARRSPRSVAQIGLARLSGGSSSSASSSDDPASRPGANARTLKKNLTLAF